MALLLSGNKLVTLFIFYGLQTVYCASGLWPYGSSYTGDQVLTKYTKGPNVVYKDKVKSVIFDLPKAINIFGKKTSQLKIYENGVVSRDIYSHVSLCPDGFKEGSYLMAFWMATDIQRAGYVFYRQEVRGKKPTLNFAEVADEIKRGAQTVKQHDFYTDSNGVSTLKENDIESIVVISWHEIAQPYSIFSNPSHRNTFQMLIVATARGSYIHINYNRIDYYHFHSRSFYCHNAAVAGITEEKYHFQLTSFFYLTPSSLRLHSNIDDFSVLGRYVLILRMRIPQPSPPRLNCISKDPDPYCKTGLPPKFCEYRSTGRYPHPTFCDKFVLCNGPITDVQTCKGLVYNPWIENCDWKHNYQCTNVNIGILEMFQDLQRAGRFEPLFSIRYDILNLNYAVHNNTCVGVPQWGNTIDISTCDHYLMCSNTRTYRVPCPPSFDGSKLYFNPIKNYCDYKRNVDCKNGIRPNYLAERPKNDTRPIIITPPPIVTRSTEATTTMSLPEGFNPCRRMGTKNSPDPLSCDHYYTCSRSMILKRARCPLSWNGKTLYYDAETDQCRYRNEVECKTDVFQKITVSPPETIPGKTNPPSILTTRTPVTRITNVPVTRPTITGKLPDKNTNGPETNPTTSIETTKNKNNRQSTISPTSVKKTTNEPIVEISTTSKELPTNDVKSTPSVSDSSYKTITSPGTTSTESSKPSDITTEKATDHYRTDSYGSTKSTVTTKDVDTSSKPTETTQQTSTTTPTIALGATTKLIQKAATFSPNRKGRRWRPC